MIVLIVIAACSDNNITENGVAESDKEGMAMIYDKMLEQKTPPTRKSDELVTTEFTICMRNNRFNIPDPEVFADGTVNMESLKQSISEDPIYLKNDRKTKDVLGICLPILENATFAGKMNSENLIDLQDKLLLFTECLSENGVKVDDPSITDDPRSSMKYILQAVDIDRNSVRNKVNSCSSGVYGKNLVDYGKD